MVKILAQFSKNCKMICQKEYQSSEKLNFIQDYEIEKNFFQTFLAFVRGFRRNVVVFWYEEVEIPGYAIRYSPIEYLNRFT